MKKAGAFEEMVRTQGWKYITSYYQNKLQYFATSLMVEDKPISEYEAERNELKGLRRVFGEVDSKLDLLKREREKK